MHFIRANDGSAWMVRILGGLHVLYAKCSDNQILEDIMNININDIYAAQATISPYAVKTPLLESPLLNKRLGGRLLIKAEPLQITGSFKLRGAINRIANLNQDEKAKGIIAYSSGNHAQAVAYAAGLFGTSAVIVMPKDAPKVKIEKTKAYGGEVVLYDRYTEDRTKVCARISEKRGLILIPPFDDAYVIAGQGTLGLEVAEQAEGMGLQLDAFLVCCSGGGLTAGCAIALNSKSPSTAVYVVEPIGFDDTNRSLIAGKIVENVAGANSICDAILVNRPGELTFPINKKLLKGGLVVSDDEALNAIAVAHDEFKLTVEPGGAVALAAVLSGKIDIKGKIIAVVCTGGNVDQDIFRKAI